MDELMLCLVGLACLTSLFGWRVPPRVTVVLSLTTIALLVAVAVLAVVGGLEVVPDGDPADRAFAAATLGGLGLLAIVGGGPVTSAVFSAIDRGEPEPESMRAAGRVLRGGAWIGALERAAVFLAVLAGWPEGLAVALAVKGLGRYPELRNGDHPGTAERFIIGTFTSVLWAVACAGTTFLLT